MDKKQIYEYGQKIGFKKWQAEKDYLQHLVLKKIYDSDLPLVFKGGTCLQKVYGLYRFSTDLDFNSIGKNIDLINICDELGDQDIILKTKKIKKTKFSENYLFEFYSDNFKNSLTIQISLREKIIKDKQPHTITTGYPIPPYILWAMNIEEILAEKIRALLMRGFPRDLYDVWYLLSVKDISINQELLLTKLDNVNLKFDKKILFHQIKKIEKDWDNEMGMLISAHPPFKEVFKELKSKV